MSTIEAAAAAAVQQGATAVPGEIYIATPDDDDVLCGRGGATNNHSGNVKYRQLVQSHQDEYLLAVKSEKKAVAASIVATIHSRGGRFLKKCTDGRPGWTDIGQKKSREKTSQALREGLDKKTLLAKGIVKEDVMAQNLERHASGVSAAAAAAAGTVIAAATSPEATATATTAATADGKRKASTDADDDGQKKKAAKTFSPTTLAEAAEAALTAAAAGDDVNAASATDGAAIASVTAGVVSNTTAPTAAAATSGNPPGLVAEAAPFDYATLYALAGATGSASAVGYYPGTSSVAGFGYPYPYHYGGGGIFGNTGFDHPALPLATAAEAADDGEDEDEYDEFDGVGETAEV